VCVCGHEDPHALHVNRCAGSKVCKDGQRKMGEVGWVGWGGVGCVCGGRLT
jgi:hypothetical protein